MQRATSGSESEWRRSVSTGCDLKPEEMSEERFKLMREYCDWIEEPNLDDEPFDFGRSGYFEKDIRLYGTFTKRPWTRSLPINVWLTKLIFGTNIMLAHLGAKIPHGKIMREESPL